MQKVTPCVGVWIETFNIKEFINSYMSHPAWVCGLKLTVVRQYIWNDWSHPAWVCGLKQEVQCYPHYTDWSHPAWVCGLKHFYCESREKFYAVTPCVGVWIETTQTK